MLNFLRRELMNGVRSLATFASALAGTGLEASGSTIRIAAAAAGDGLTGGAGSALAVNVGTGLEISSDAVRIAAAAAGDGLTGGAGSALAVNAGAGLEISSDAVRIAAAAAGAGLTGGAGSALAVGAGNGITVNADDVAVKDQVRTIDGLVTLVTGIATAATALAESVMWGNKRGATVTITAIHVLSSASHAGNDTNNFQIVIQRRDSAGANNATVVDYTNNVASGGVTANVMKSLGAVSNGTIAADEVLTVTVNKNGGSGQALGAAAWPARLIITATVAA